MEKEIKGEEKTYGLGEGAGVLADKQEAWRENFHNNNATPSCFYLPFG